MLSRQPHDVGRSVLWWSRSGRDYSRDRILRQAFEQLGWTIRDFKPVLSAVGDWQAWLQRVETPDLVWVPCFRNRDVSAAARWAHAHRVPLVFDPLISAYDKVVNERECVTPDSPAARRLLSQEAAQLKRCNAVIADTHCHADYYSRQFNLNPDNVSVIPVGAESGQFTPQPWGTTPDRVRVLFYGSFIGLQGPEVIAAAARLVPEVDWRFIGDGPLKPQCQALCEGLPHVKFTPWIPYEQLPSHIGQADILLGVFGSSQKASRVIPNKVYQSLACGRMVVTRRSEAYPAELLSSPATDTGLQFISSGSAEALADAVRDLAGQSADLPKLGQLARQSYERHFNSASIVSSLDAILTGLLGRSVGSPSSPRPCSVTAHSVSARSTVTER